MPKQSVEAIEREKQPSSVSTTSDENPRKEGLLARPNKPIGRTNREGVGAIFRVE